VRRLEHRPGAAPPVKPQRPTTLDEIRAIEKEIARIEAEMRAAGMSEAEIRGLYVELSPLEELEAMEAEIRRIEAREEA
jgi:hypothetical protein